MRAGCHGRMERRGHHLRRPLGQHLHRTAAHLDQVPRQLQALRLAPGERGHGLPEPQVIEAHVRQRLQARHHVLLAREEGERLVHRELEHLGDGAPVHLHLEHLVAVAPAVAVRAAQVHVGEELHLDVLEAVAAAGGAAPVAGVEAEGAGRVAARLRFRRAGEDVADGVERAHVARGVGARGAADGRLVHEHHVVDARRAVHLAEGAGRFRRLAQVLEQRRVQHVLDERGFPRARDARHAHEAVEGELDVDVLEVVLGDAAKREPRRIGGRRPGSHSRVRALPAREVLRRHRLRVLQLVRRAVEHDLAAALARPRSHVEQAVGLQHDLRVVLDHHERVAGVAQALHHVDHAPHVARVQADRRLVQHEERVHERGAQRRGEVDALHLAAGERARLPVEREVAQAHLAHEAKPRVDSLQQQFGRLVQRGGQREALEEGPRPLDGQQHHVVQAQARERGQLVEAPLRAARGIAPLGGEHRVGLGLGAHAPEHGLGLEARAVAVRAGRVGAVLREQHADVHLVGLRLQPLEEARHAVPVRLAGLVPAHPALVAVDHPAAVLRREVAPRDVERHAVALRVLHDVVLALVEALRLEGLHRALAEGLRLVRDHQAVVHADHAPEAAALVARADGGVEGEARGGGVGIVDVAVGAVQVVGEAPRLLPARCRRTRSPAPSPPAAPPRSPPPRAPSRPSPCGCGPAPRPAASPCASARACSPAPRGAAGSRPR